MKKKKKIKIEETRIKNIRLPTNVRKWLKTFSKAEQQQKLKKLASAFSSNSDLKIKFLRGGLPTLGKRR